MKKPEIDYSKWSKEDLILKIQILERNNSILNSTIDILKSHRESMLGSNETLMRIIKSGTVYVNGEPVDLSDDKKDEHLTVAKPSQDAQELERIAFDPKTPEKEAKKALRQLIKLTKKK